MDLENGSRDDDFIDGSKMLSPKLKLKYEQHYWDTDAAGSDESDWSTLNLKAIYFARDGQWNGRPYRLAVGLEWIKNLGGTDKGIGPGVDQLAPLAGVTLKFGDAMLIPLVEHFYFYSGDDLNQTAMRLIGLKPLANRSWAKLDVKVPYDWENDEVLASIELQLGKSFSPSSGLYVDVLAGIGGDKPFDSGIGVGARLDY